jgi:hypothetical protein
MTRTHRIFSFGVVGALAVAAYAVQASHQLTIDGSLVSTSVTFEHGRYLVPVDDIAKYLGDTEKTNGGNPILTHQTANGAVVAPGATPTTTVDAGVKLPPTPQDPVPANVTPPVSTTPGPLNPGTSTFPTIAVPGTPISTANSNLLPSAPVAPTQLTSTIGQGTAVGGFTYTVDSIQDVGNKYKLEHDQHGATIHPTFKSDSLVVVNLSVTNSGTQPISPVVPGMADITVFDSEKLGYPAGYLDMRQSSELVEAGGDSSYDIAPGGGTGVVLAPGGTLHFAAVASVPSGSHVSFVTLHVGGQAMTGSSTPQDSVITINR